MCEQNKLSNRLLSTVCEAPNSSSSREVEASQNDYEIIDKTQQHIDYFLTSK